MRQTADRQNLAVPHGDACKQDHRAVMSTRSTPHCPLETDHTGEMTYPPTVSLTDHPSQPQQHECRHHLPSSEHTHNPHLRRGRTVSPSPPLRSWRRAGIIAGHGRLLYQASGAPIREGQLSARWVSVGVSIFKEPVVGVPQVMDYKTTYYVAGGMAQCMGGPESWKEALARVYDEGVFVGTIVMKTTIPAGNEGRLQTA